MEFDKSRVYTAVNADELKVGSRCIFAKSLGELKERFLTAAVYGCPLVGIRNEFDPCRFDDGDGTHLLAYLFEPAGAQEYKPFSSTEKALEAIRKHGGWVKNVYSDFLFFVTGVDIGGKNRQEILIEFDWHSAAEFVDDYVFVDDGSHCGELVEE